VSYEDVDLTNIGDVTARVFAALQRFSVRASVETTQDPTFVGVEARRRDALMRAVSAAAPHWSATQQRAAAGLLDALWHVPTYERLVGVWGVDGAAATRAIDWLMTQVVTAITNDNPPPA
jgi:hypothetical protein